MSKKSINLPLVSIIVPVYNVAPYIRRCIDSILCQTYTNIEVWLVDDGSTDASSSICDDYISVDNRINVIHKNNGGLSSARNAALDKCIGEYLLFVDSDDLISPNAVELLVNTALECMSDIVVTKKFIRFNNHIEVEHSKYSEIISLNNLDALQEILCRNTRWEAWGTLYSSSLFDTLRFPEGKLYEDFAIVPIAIYNACQVSIVDTAIYYYYYREGSIMHPKNSIVSIDLCEISMTLLEFLESKVYNRQILANICSGILMELCSRVDYASKNIKSNIEFINEARGILRSNILLMMASECYNMKRKIYYMMEAFGGHRLIHVMYNLFNS